MSGLGHNAKWDSVVSIANEGVGEADVACTKKMDTLHH